MTAREATRRALIVGRDEAEVLALHEAVARILPRGTVYLAMEIDTTSVDPALAWGTALPVVHELVPPVTGSIVQPAAQPSSEHSPGSMHPLPEDGDSWKAIDGVGRRFNADVIVMMSLRQGWIGRFFSGSAAEDLVARGELPVLLVHERHEPATPAAGGGPLC